MVKKSQVPYLLALLLTSSGCELIEPKHQEKLPLGQVRQIEVEEQPDVIYQELSNEAAGKGAGEQMQNELYPGDGRFVAAQPSGPKRAGKPGGGEYSLNFDDADLGEVAKVILSDILGQNYLLSPKVGGTVTLQTTQPLTRAELLPTLEMLLQANGAALIYQEGLYQIKPAAEVAINGTFVGKGGRAPAGSRIMVVPVKNVGVEDLAEIIKPLVGEKTVLHTDSSRNIMLLAGSGEEMARALEMVNAFDVNVMRGKSFGLYPLRNVDPQQLIEELKQVFGSGKDEGGSFFRFLPIERLNAVLAITHKSDYLRDIERWIVRLDRANTSAGGGVIVYRAQHVDAVEMAATLNDIFGTGGRSSGRAPVAAGRQPIEVTNKAQRDDKPVVTTAGANTSSLSNLGDVKIIPDEINNALVIVATAQDYAVIERVIKQLDVMPLQVLVDATIVEVTLTDELEYGIKWFITHNGVKNAAGSNTENLNLSDLAADLALSAATGGFGYAFVGNDFKAVLNAAATDNKVNVISSPSLMVLNNQEASIQVGDEVPIRTSESANTSGGADPIITSQIQQRKTGVKLKVKPRVNASGLVIMDIEQSVENVTDRTAAGSNIDSPAISTREIISSVAVHSGETIVLGGLIKDDDSFNKGGIPVIHELPLIGPLFGSTSTKNTKTELVVLITPRVVRSKQDGRLVTDEFKRKLTGIYEKPVEATEEM